MEAVVPLIILILTALGFGMFYVIQQITKLKTSTQQDVLMEWLKEMRVSTKENTDTLQKQLHETKSLLDQQLQGQRESLNSQINNQQDFVLKRLEEYQKVIREVQNQLGGIQEFGKDMKDLSNILKSPKMRGGLGEQFLYEILANALPNSLYKTQYKFKIGDACDAVVLTDKGMIPVDSKFPMENFKLFLGAENEEAREKAKKAFVMDVKKRIDETAKYILPDEGTTNQAVMYIPSESIFYELIVNSPQIEDYAKHKNVVLSSPNTLSYFLKVILVAFQHQKLEKHTTDILKTLSGLKIEADKVNEELNTLEKHISNSFKAIENVKSRYAKFTNKLDIINELDKPKQEALTPGA